MAYRTYKNIFRVRAEISSIGTGSKRIVFPEGWVITGDVFLMIAISLPLFRYLLAPIINIFISYFLGINHPIFLWIEAAIMATSLSFFLHKKEAAGKTPVQFLSSVMRYFFRSSIHKWSDGWEMKKINLQSHKDIQMYMSRYDDRVCGSLPARAQGLTRFTLNTAAAVRVRGDRIEFTRSGRKFPAGDYMVQDKKIVAVAAVSKRRVPSLREEE